MLIDINLLPQKERDRPIHLIVAGSIVLLTLILWAVLFSMTQGEESSHQELLAQSAEVTAEQALIRQEIEASQGMNEEQQLLETVTWAESYQFDTVPLIAELVTVLPERGFFDSFSYTGPNTATLTLQFDTAREAAYYLTQLKTSEVLASATLDSVANQELGLTEEETAANDDDALVQNPRYLATYTLLFVDGRIPAEGTAVAEDGTIIQEATEEAPVETAPETETAPEETEGDVQ
ncbi:PilN domain-containing protein [Planomicrobium sp. MB-3u-38]|uniref:PilN domain-containing protein n=1 Tax=Planomicrobium sp. MB-3u-38 TaxID=2058318 RepID=UPI000C7996BB|nr:fimbrial assembly protein [Planomicrobium sp. MB-3u-38]PKH08463.1 fimbrial assembly protein [Planomicrobium sp. MB-3u-38]